MELTKNDIKTKNNKKKKKNNKYPYMFIAPTLVLLMLFYIIPILVALGISFTDIDLAGLANFSKVDFIGFENYINLFSDELFKTSIVNTMVYVFIGVPTVVFLSLGVAILLNYGTDKIFGFFRGVYYTPSITNAVAVAVVWGYIYNSQYGLLNSFLSWFDIAAVGWLTDPMISKISLIIVAVWKGIGINMVIFLAALKSVPKSYYEAADLDGANRFQRLRYITLPSIKFSIFFVTTTTLIGWVQFFEEAFVLTEGGPLNSTLSMALYIYQKGFSRSQFGYAAAASFILFAIIITVTIIQFKLRKKESDFI